MSVVTLRAVRAGVPTLDGATQRIAFATDPGVVIARLAFIPHSVTAGWIQKFANITSNLVPTHRTACVITLYRYK